MSARKVIYGGACSLDGYFTGKDGALDWLHMSKDVDAIMRQSWDSADTILAGRKTWEFAKAMGGGGEMPGIKVKSYVFSRTLTSIAEKDTELVTTDAGAFVRKLKTQPGKDIIVMSGGNFATSLLREGVIDEIGLNIGMRVFNRIAHPRLSSQMHNPIKISILERTQECLLIRETLMNKLEFVGE